MSRLRKILLTSLVLLLIAPAALPQPVNPYVLTAAKITAALGYAPATSALTTNHIFVGVGGVATDTATLPAAALPNPSSSTLGGVQSKAAVSSNYLTSISTSGVPVAARPTCSDLSDSVASCSVYGLPTFTLSTPTAASEIGTITTQSTVMYTAVFGKITFINLTITITSAGTGSGFLNVSLPSTSLRAVEFAGGETGVTGSAVTGRVLAGGTQVSIKLYNAVTCIASGAVVTLSGFYETN